MLNILLPCARPDVVPLAVQPIEIFMIYQDIGISNAQNESVEVDNLAASRCSVDILNRPVFLALDERVPFELRDSFNIIIIYERDVPLGERNLFHTYELLYSY